MARYGLAVCLVVIAGAHLAAAQAGNTGADARPASAQVLTIPEGLATFDVTSLASAIPVLATTSMDTAMGIVGLAPKLNVTWVDELIPYMNQLDPKVLGPLAAAVIVPVQKIDPAVLGAVLPAVNTLDAKGVAALVPALATLNVTAVEKLVPAINGFAPETLGSLMKLLGALTPETYSALTNIVNAAIPALNLVGAKLNAMPVQVAIPAPQPYVAPAATAAPAAKSFFSFLG